MCQNLAGTSDPLSSDRANKPKRLQGSIKGFAGGKALLVIEKNRLILTVGRVIKRTFILKNQDVGKIKPVNMIYKVLDDAGKGMVQIIHNKPRDASGKKIPSPLFFYCNMKTNEIIKVFESASFTPEATLQDCLDPNADPIWAIIWYFPLYLNLQNISPENRLYKYGRIWFWTFLFFIIFAFLYAWWLAYSAAN